MMKRYKRLTLILLSSITFSFVLFPGWSATSGKKKSKNPSMLVHFFLNGEVTEAPKEGFSFASGKKKTICLNELCERFRNIILDKQVKGIIITFSELKCGFAQLEEIRESILQLQEAGKPVYVHAESMFTPHYMLFSSASRLNMSPESTLFLTGLYGEALFFKELLKKLGIVADVIQVGAYKSAAEMFSRNGPSKAAEENINWLLDGLYDSLVGMIAKARQKDQDEIRKLIDHGPYTSDQAVEKGLIDSSVYIDQFLDEIKKEIGGDITINNHYDQAAIPDINISNPMSVLSLFSKITNKKSTSNGIALIIAEGPIYTGYGESNKLSGKAAYSGVLRSALQKALEEPSIKAVVMRVDSPGGSATACEIVLRATEKVKEVKKPFIVSFGNVAASGGYYISCAGDTIFADPTSITGSIGVIGGKPVCSELLKKIGVERIAFKRGENADLVSIFQAFSPEQKKKLSGDMRHVYNTFKQHIVKYRVGKLTKPIEEVAEGRVYTGKQALKLGLVDKLGSLSNAIKLAADNAKLKQYEIRIIPRPKNFFEMLKELFVGSEHRNSDLSVRISGKPLSSIETKSGIYALIPLIDTLSPKLSESIHGILQKAELLQRENILLMMPYDIILY